MYKRDNYNGAACAHLLGNLVPNFCSNSLRNVRVAYKVHTKLTPIRDCIKRINDMFRGPGARCFGTSSASRLTFPYRGTNVSPRQVQRHIRSITRRFRVERLLNHEVVALSNNRGRRLTITTSAVLTPKLVIVSRPADGLSVITVHELRSVITRLETSKVAVIVTRRHLT